MIFNKILPCMGKATILVMYGQMFCFYVGLTSFPLTRYATWPHHKEKHILTFNSNCKSHDTCPDIPVWLKNGVSSLSYIGHCPRSL